MAMRLGFVFWVAAVVLSLSAIVEGEPFAIDDEATCAADDETYFDSTSYLCVTCPKGEILGADNICRCPIGKLNVTPDELEPLVFTCEDTCAASLLATSVDSSQCLSCDAASGAVYDADTQDCSCLNGNSILSEVNSAGLFLGTKVCVTCPASAYVDQDEDPYSCISCPDPNMVSNGDGSCECDNSGADSWVQSGDVCLVEDQVNEILTTYSVDAASLITYRSVRATDTRCVSELVCVPVFLFVLLLSLCISICLRTNWHFMISIHTHTHTHTHPRSSDSSTDVSSATYTNLFLTNAVQCKFYQIREACQTLLHLCLMQMYNEDLDPCSLYKEIENGVQTTEHEYREWKTSMPLLMFEDDRILRDNTIQQTVLFSPVSADEASGDRALVADILFWLATYTLEGEFLGYSQLDSQLMLCGEAPRKASSWLRFGTDYLNNCELDLASLLTEDQFFYELFFVDQDDLVRSFSISLYIYICVCVCVWCLVRMMSCCVSAIYFTTHTQTHRSCLFL
jgi:meckelin